MNWKRFLNVFILCSLAGVLATGIMTCIDVTTAMQHDGKVTSDYNYYGEMKFELVIIYLTTIGSTLGLYFLTNKIARGEYII